MTDEETAIRITAWTWAAHTLGQEVKMARIDGLVEVTEVVSAENLKEAIKQAIKASPSGFLPSPNLVISCGAKIAEHKRLQLAQAERDRIRASASRQVIAERAGGGKAPATMQREASATIEQLREKIRMGAMLEKSRSRSTAKADRPQMSEKTLAAVRKVSRLSDDEKAAWLARELREELKRKGSQ